MTEIELHFGWQPTPASFSGNLQKFEFCIQWTFSEFGHIKNGEKFYIDQVLLIYMKCKLFQIGHEY